MIIIDNLLAEDLFYRIKRILEKGRNNIDVIKVFIKMGK